jgi:hypothetical protein
MFRWHILPPSVGFLPLPSAIAGLFGLLFDAEIGGDIFSETSGFPRTLQSHMSDDSAPHSTAVRTLNPIRYKNALFRIIVFKRGSRTAPQGSQMQQGASLYSLA